MSIPFRGYKRLDVWKDSQDEGRSYTRIFIEPRSIVLPGEYDDYLERHGKVYRVEKSESGFSWVLCVDEKEYPLGWDQKGIYLRTLVLCRNGNKSEAFHRARDLLPNEKAIWVCDGFEQGSLPGDELFEEWFKGLL